MNSSCVNKNLIWHYFSEQDAEIRVNLALSWWVRTNI